MIRKHRRRRFWADARFLIGLCLIAASIGGVWFVVTTARQTTQLLATTGTIVPGETVTAARLRVVDVAIGTAEDGYLAPAELADGVVATRTVGEGELLPAAAVTDAADAEVTTVVVPSAVDVPRAVVAGSVVDVWESPEREDGASGEPRVLLSAVTVADVIRDDAVIGDDAVSLELIVDRGDVQPTLSAIGSGSALSAVPAGGAR